MKVVSHTTPQISSIVQALKKQWSFCMGCEVCESIVRTGDTCCHPKNGYCALFRLQAAKDSVEFNVKTK